MIAKANEVYYVLRSYLEDVYSEVIAWQVKRALRGGCIARLINCPVLIEQLSPGLADACSFVVAINCCVLMQFYGGY